MRQPAPIWDEFGDTPEPKRAIESGNLPAALSGFATRYLLDYRHFKPPHADDYVIGFGAVLWMMGDVWGAASVWSKVCEDVMKGRYHYSSMGNLQGGLLLWFASVWLKDEDYHEEAAALLNKLLRRKRLVMGASFPNLLAKLLRREVDLTEVQASYAKESRQTRESYDWLALFYAGVRAYEDGQLAETRHLWAQIPERKDPSVVLEYYLLDYQRRKLMSTAQ